MKSADATAHELFLLMGELARITDPELAVSRFMKVFGNIWPDTDVHITANNISAPPESIPIKSGDLQFGYLVFDHFNDLNTADQILITSALSLLAVILKKHELESLSGGETQKLQSMLEEKTQELLTQNSLLQQIAENYPHSYISIIEKDFTIGFTAGKEFQENNLDPESYVGLTLEQVFGEQAAFVKEQYVKTFRGNQQEFELRINNQDQLYKTVPLKSESGRIDRILAVVENITDRKKVETRLRESRDHLSIIFNSNRDLQVLVEYEGDRTFRVVEANQSYLDTCNQYGLSITADDLIGQTLADIILGLLGLDEETLLNTVNRYQKAIDTGRQIKYEDSIIVSGQPYHSVDTLYPIQKTSDNRQFVVFCSHNVTAEKEALSALRKSEENYRLLVDNTPDFIYSFDRESRHTAVNRSICKAMGLSESEIVGKTHTELGFPREIAEEWQALHEEVFRTGKTIETETDTVMPDGKIHNYLVVLIPVFDEQGEVISIRGTSRDITERKRAETELQNLKAFFEDVTENVQDGIWVTDKDDVIFYANRGMESIAGVPKETFIGKNVLSDFPQKSADHFNISYKKAKNSLQPTWYEITFKNSEGADVWQNGWLVPTLKNDSFDGIICTIRDVTDSKYAEKALRNSEAKYRLLIENLSEGVWYIDQNANTTYVNQRMAEMLGYTVDELIGKHLFEFMDEPGRSIAQNKLEHRKNGFREQHDFEFIRKDGEHIHALIETTPVLDENNQYSGAIAGVLDITKRVKAENALKISEKKFRSFYEHSPFGILSCEIIRDTEGKAVDFIHLECNSATAEHAGIGIDRLMGKKASEIVEEKVLADLIERYDNVITTGDALSYNEHFEVYDKTLQVTVFGLEGDRFIINFIDITDQKHAEDALQISENRLSLAVSVSGLGIYEHDIPIDKNAYHSERWARILGYTPDELPLPEKRREWQLKRIHPEDLPMVEKAYYRFTEGSISKFDVEFRIQHKSEKYIYIHDSAEAVRCDSKGKVLALIGTTKDITEHKQILQRLQDRNEYIERILDNMPIGFAINTIDDGDVKYMNREFEKIYGWSKDIITNFDIFFEKVFPDPVVRNEMKSMIMSDIESGAPERMRWKDLKIVTSTGEERYVYAWNIPLSDENLMISTVQDTTRQKLNTEQITDALREKETLLRELYHRTKNNMNVIQSMLKLQAAFSKSTEVNRIVKEMEHKIQGMALVHQKLYQSQNLSRIQLQEYIPELAELIRQGYSLSPSKVSLKLNIEPVSVLIDTAIPCGLLLNELMSNAFKHAFPNDRSGEIHIRLTIDDHENIAFHVSDDGIGVPQGFDFYAQETLGLQSIIMIATHQLQGAISFAADEGVTCRIEFADTSYQARV